MTIRRRKGLAKLRAQVESGKVTWDVVDMGAADAILACDEGLIEARSIPTPGWLPLPMALRHPRTFLPGPS